MRDAVERSTRWAREACELRPTILAPTQLCFGIVQGGTDLALRRAHLAELAPLPFDGLALGGLSVGEPIPADARHPRGDRPRRCPRIARATSWASAPRTTCSPPSAPASTCSTA
jgi:hypothetical protein